MIPDPGLVRSGPRGRSPEVRTGSRRCRRLRRALGPVRQGFLSHSPTDGVVNLCLGSEDHDAETWGLPFPRSHVDDSHVDETIASVVRDGRAEHQRPRCGTEDVELSRRRGLDLLGLAGPGAGFAAHRCRQRCRAARVGRADGILEVVVFFAVFASRDRSKAEDRVVTGSAVWARSTGSDQKTHGYGGDLESYMYRGLAIRPAIRP